MDITSVEKTLKELLETDPGRSIYAAVGAQCFLRSNTNDIPVRFYRNAFPVSPRSNVKLVTKMLKASHAQESKKAAQEKAKVVV